jgi:UDP:flavonoid glycosyltransferase YjiC (YdhE family)
MKILFASMPVDGHFNPLTGIAVHLRKKGHDVGWYTGPSYAEKMARLDIPHFPFERATEINGDNLTERFPEYSKLGEGPRAIAFALEKIFFGNLEAHLRDITALRARFRFEAIVFDAGFYAGRLVSEKLAVPAYPIWPGPTPAPTSKEAPPPFFGLKPARGPFGALRDWVVTKLLASSMKSGMEIWHDLRAREGLAPFRGSLMDVHNDTSRTMFMVGAPGLDFPRRDWPKNLRFVGALVPHKRTGRTLPDVLREKLARSGGRVVVVSQGTIDNRDPDKLFVPSLEALADGNGLVVVATGGRHTDTLRRRFPQEQVVIENWIDFDLLMPHATLFICNGGYGSVLQAIAHGVPLLVAGASEAKNDINARLDYCGLALDLRTERPTRRQILRGVERVLSERRYRENIARVRAELATYDAFAIIEREVVGMR